MMLAATLDLGQCTNAERSRVMARLGSALSYSQHERANELAVAALELARTDGSRTDLAYAIRCRLRGWFDPDRQPARLDLSRELTTIGGETGDGVSESWGWHWQTALHFERGDVPAIEEAGDRLEALAVRLHLPNQQFSVAIRRAATRVMQGRFAEADTLITTAAQHADRLDNRLHVGLMRSVCRTLDWLRGDEQRFPIDHAAVFDDDGEFLWLANDPASVLDALERDPATFFDSDISRLGEICAVALTIREHPRPQTASLAYPYAAATADYVAAISPEAAMYGSMHLYAGILARVAGDHGGGCHHLRRAIDVNAAIGALPFLALAMHELAEMEHDPAVADDLASRSQALAKKIGVQWLS